MRTTVAAAVLALALATGGCLPPEAPPPAPPNAPLAVRIHERGARDAVRGVLVALDAGRVRWREEARGDSVTRSLPLSAVARVEVGDRLSQRAACRRGLIQGGAVGALLGAGFWALRRDEPGGAVGFTLGGAWLGCVLTGQQTQSPQPPLRWRVVYPAPAG